MRPSSKMLLITKASEATANTTSTVVSLQCRQQVKRGQRLLLLTVLLLLQLCSCLPPCNAWMPDVRPDLPTKQDKIMARFFGNATDYFKILEHNDANILVGARDVIYNISLHGLRELNRLEWHSTDADRELCALKGKHETDCHNYIRVFARLPGAEGQLLVCGTNSYKPRCRHYAPTAASDAAADAAPMVVPLQQYEVVRDVEAQGLCPYSPVHNSTYAYAEGQLYSATVADFSGSDPLIYRENLRTEQYDLKQLNQPDFVGAVERKGYILFFLREIAMEYMNFGKTIYSRVARVCKNDRGGPYTLSKSWTSFLKARLNCSVPGEPGPFYFDEIQAISPVVERGAAAYIYAVFTTGVNAISGSAVCAFSVDDIMDAFDGRFKSQKDSQSHWLPIEDDQVPEPRPGQCVDDSRMLSSIAVNFVKNHPLMETAVPAVNGRPVLTKVNLHHRLTAIAIDPHVRALHGAHHDVVYVGTDDGKITKFIDLPATQYGDRQFVLISELQVLPMGVPVRELVISTATNTLLVVSDGSLVTVPLHHCAHIVDCLGCLSLQDPNCAWDQQNHECKSLAAVASNKFGTKAYLQSLNTTKKAAAALCPKSARGPVVVNSGSDGIGSMGSIASVGIDLQAAQMPQSDEELLLNKKLHYAKVGGAAAPAVTTTSAEVGTALGGDFALNSFSDEQTPQLDVDPDDLMNSLNDPLLATADQRSNTQVAGKSLIYFGMIGLLIFTIGIGIGLYCSRRKCKATAQHMNHRNEFGPNSPFNIKHGKDSNLLKTPNHYHCSQQKKPNLDLEKDRSHECKNSTENLEKELPCKTSTLTKVKRTYI